VLRAGIHGTVTVTDDEARAAMADLARAGLRIGESGAAPLAGLRRLARAREPLLAPESRVLIVATEGPTGPGSGRS
jgi:diaminopropionate ammonia-lyase